jgi:hypothetical protein
MLHRTEVQRPTLGSHKGVAWVQSAPDLHATQE